MRARCVWVWGVAAQLSGKARVVSELLSSVRRTAPGERVVLVSGSTRVLDVFAALAERRGWATSRLDGATPADQRSTIITAWHEALPPSRSGGAGGRVEPPFLFLLSARSGGCGLNLIGANRLILCDPSRRARLFGRR